VIVLGIDPSSSCSGHALVEGDDMIGYGVWTPTPAEEKAKGATRIFAYYSWLNTWIGLRRSTIELAVVEELAVMRGAKTARVLAHFEAAALIACKRHGLIVVRVKAADARHQLLGLPITATKEEAHAVVKQNYPQLKLPRKGGADVADAFVMAKAGLTVLGS